MPAPNPLLSKPLAAADASTLRAFERRLRSAKKSDKTVQSYLEAPGCWRVGWVAASPWKRSGLPTSRTTPRRARR
jgi:hypothetical protein